MDSLPLGFRFRPTDEELVDYYLRLKINGNEDEVRVIREIDICKWEPWDLPDLSVIKMKDSEWFFFCPRDQKYPNGRRSNRATTKGYWKATGNDRKIMSGMNLIGMKRSLVFHMGRAPKGKRTNWIIHEYRAEKMHDAVNQDQAAYVLCRLFKKQDESVEGATYDKVEPTFSFPTIVKSCPEDTESELALAEVSPEAGEHENTSGECCFTENSDRLTVDTPAPVECHNNGYSVYDDEFQGLDMTSFEEDPQLEEQLKFFYDPIPEPLDCKLFSPLHSQMQAELGSSCMYYPVNNDLSNSHSGMQLQYGTNETDGYISGFLNSVINNSDESTCEESCIQKNLNMLEPVTQDYMLSGEKSDRNASSVDNFASVFGDREFCLDSTSNRNNGDTGIMLRTRKLQNMQHNQNYVKQGLAPRRIHLQCKLQVHTHVSSKDLSNSSCRGDEHESELITEVGKNADGGIISEGIVGDICTRDENQKISPSRSRENIYQELKPRSKKVASMFLKTHAQLRSVVLAFRIAGVILMFITFFSVSRCLYFNNAY